MNRNLIAILIVSACVILPGCIFTTEPFKPIAFYDLGHPECINNENLPVRIGDFGMRGPYKFNMVYRKSATELSRDDYSKWAQSPELLLSSYLGYALGDSPQKDAWTISGTVLVFEADVRQGRAVLAVSISLSKGADARSKKFTRSYSAPLAGMAAKDFADAMSAAAGELANDLLKEMKEL